MSIVELTPSALPIDLRFKVEHVMRERRLTWEQTLLFLAREVVSPVRVSGERGSTPSSFCREVVSP